MAYPSYVGCDLARSINRIRHPLYCPPYTRTELNSAFSIGYQNNAMQLLSRDWKLLAEQQSQLSYPFIKREIKRLRELLLRFADSKEMQQALKDAGLPDNAWLRLQQQRHHIVKQCKKAALW
jgi:serine/threonine-protein kinase HipA